MTGTGHGTILIFSNVGGSGGDQIRVRARRVATLTGQVRDAVDFSDLSTNNVMDLRPGDHMAPGGFDIEFLADPTGSETDRPSVAQVADIIAARNPEFTVTFDLPSPHGQIVSRGFVLTHDGPELAPNVPMEHRITWQDRGDDGDGTGPIWTAP